MGWCDKLMSLLFFGYLGDTQTVEVRRKADGYKLLVMTKMREDDRKEEQHFDDIIR